MLYYKVTGLQLSRWHTIDHQKQTKPVFEKWIHTHTKKKSMLSDRLSVRCDNAQRDWMISHAASFLLQREREKVCLFAYTVRISAWFPAHSSRQENCYLKNNCAVISEYGPYLCGTVCVCVRRCKCGVCCHWVYWAKTHSRASKPRWKLFEPCYPNKAQSGEDESGL